MIYYSKMVGYKIPLCYKQKHNWTSLVHCQDHCVLPESFELAANFYHYDYLGGLYKLTHAVCNYKKMGQMLPNLLFESTKMLHYKNEIQAEKAKPLNIPLVDRDASSPTAFHKGWY